MEYVLNISYKICVMLKYRMFVPLSEGDGPEQGSEKWFKKRKHKMTGSKPSSIMFECKDEESYHKMWNQIFGYAEREKFSEDQQKKVDWGKNREDEACETFYKNLPGTIVYETSIIDHPVYHWIAASPDGYVVRVEVDENNVPVRYDGKLKVIERANLEIKCPNSQYYPDCYKMAKELIKKKSPPYYYMAQLHFEMVALGVKTTYFYMWTPWYSKLWKINFDMAYWIQTVDVLNAFRKKSLSWPILKSKLDVWINTSQAIANKYKTHKEYKTIEEEKWQEEVKKETQKPERPRTDSVPIYIWYNDKSVQILNKLYGKSKT